MAPGKGGGGGGGGCHPGYTKQSSCLQKRVYPLIYVSGPVVFLYKRGANTYNIYYSAQPVHLACGDHKPVTTPLLCPEPPLPSSPDQSMGLLHYGKKFGV